MHRLRGEDAGFLLMDVPGQPMSSMALGVLEPEHATLTLDDVRRHVAARLDELPSWRWRVVPVPGELHRPVAVRVGQPSLDDHVREVSVAGGSVELEAWFAGLAEEHLPLDRPLWQVWLVTGLDEGRQVLAVKYHHALADGVGAMATFGRIFSDLPYAPLPPVPGHRLGHWPGRRHGERSPGWLRLVATALWAWLVALVLLPGLVARTLAGVRRLRRQRASDAALGLRVPDHAGGAPRTRLNVAPDSPTAGRRRYVRAGLDLSDLKRVKEAAGVTLNDVVLAVVAGACVRTLGDELPSRPLLTTVPMSAEPPGAPARQFGNHFWSFTTSLATDVADPWERLLAISRLAGAGKRQLEALGVGLVPAWLDVLPVPLARRGIHATLARLSDPERDVDASVLVSNVRGPAQPWSIGGRVFGEIHLDGPPSNGVGCNVMVWSYGDRVLLGVLAYADALADPAGFRAALHESAAELVAAARARAGAGAEPGRSVA